MKKVEINDVAAGLLAFCLFYVIGTGLQLAGIAGVSTAAISWMAGWTLNKNKMFAAAAVVFVIGGTTLIHTGVVNIKEHFTHHQYSVLDVNGVQVVKSKKFNNLVLMNELAECLARHQYGRVVILPVERAGHLYINGDKIPDKYIEGAVIINQLKSTKGFFGHEYFVAKGPAFKIKWSKGDPTDSHCFNFNPRLIYYKLKSI